MKEDQQDPRRRRRRVRIALVIVVAGFLAWMFGFIPGGQTDPIPVGPAFAGATVEPQIATVFDQAIMLAPNGTLWAWGGLRASLGRAQRSSELVRVWELWDDSDWKDVALTGGFFAALKQDGSLWFRGELKRSTYQRKRLGTDDDWKDVCAGSGHFLLLKEDGSLWGWRENDSGQLGMEDREFQEVPVPIESAMRWRSIAAAGNSSYAIRQDGSLWGWGDMLGRKPNQLDPSTNWAAVSAGAFYVLALKTDGTLWISGWNAQRAYPRLQMGTADLKQVGTHADWIKISAGSSFFLAQKKDGTWWGSGQNKSGQLGLGHRRSQEEIRRLTFIPEDPWVLETGVASTFVLGRDGKLWSWGERLGAPFRNALGIRIKQWLSSLLGIPNLNTSAPKGSFDVTPVQIADLVELMAPVAVELERLKP